MNKKFWAQDHLEMLFRFKTINQWKFQQPKNMRKQKFHNLK